MNTETGPKAPPPPPPELDIASSTCETPTHLWVFAMLAIGLVFCGITLDFFVDEQWGFRFIWGGLACLIVPPIYDEVVDLIRTGSGNRIGRK
jgi:hypothetical protein